MQKRLQQSQIANLLLLCFNSIGIYFYPKLQFCKIIKSKQVTLLLVLMMSISGYAQLPTETFESGIPASWTLFGNDHAVSEWEISNDAYQGSNAVFINPSADNIGADNSAEYFLVTPSITLPENGEIRFYTKRSTSLDNENISYQVRLSTATQPDINGFNVILQSWDGTNLNEGSQTEYEEKIIAIPSTIPSGLDIYVAFVAVNTQTGAEVNGDAWYIDNIRLIESCLLVEEANISISGITTSAATISWTHPSITNFEIQVVEQGLSPSSIGVAVNGSSYLAENLDPETTYDIYIQTVCDSETSSSWAGPFSFTTLQLGMLCESPIIITASEGSPFSFDTNLMYYPNANEVLYSTHGSNCLSESITENYLLGNKIFLSYTADQDGLINISQMTLPWSSGTECWGNAISSVFIYENCSTIGVECLAGLNTTATSQPKTIENFPVTSGTEYIIVISTSLSGTDASICFEFDLSFTTCPTPSEFTYENLLQESVLFSWNNPINIAESWEYVVAPVADPAPTGSGTPTATNENVLIENLTAGTAYNLYVRPVCDGTPGEWGAPYAFTTQCDVFETPYFTGFEGSDASNPEPCWTSIDANDDGVKWTYQGGWEDGYLGYATLNTNTNQNFNNDYLVSPQINFNGVQKRIRFSQQVGWGGSSSYSIKISTTGVGVDNFTYTLLPETVISNEAWQEVIYNIPVEVTGLVNIAWVVSPVGSGQEASRISFTNVYIEDKPACPDPIAPMLIEGSETTDSAQFSWTVGEIETQWEVLVLPINDPEPTSESTGIIVTENPYTYEGLMSSKRYKFYVRAYCSDEFQSNWVGPVEFITNCTTFDTPFYESFDDADDNTQKFCWTINNANTDGAQWIMEVNNPELRGSTSWFNPTTGYDDWLISPPINAVGNKELRFSYRARLNIFSAAMRYGLQVLISHTDTNPESFEELIPLYDFTNTDYLENSAYFQANGTIYIAFRVPPDFVIAPGTSILDIDDVYIDDAPACPSPNNLVVQNISANEATISWSQAFIENQWEVVLQENGLPIPTEAQAIVDQASFTSGDVLAPGTTYDFYVRAVCDGGANSSWVGPLTFTTLCSPFTTPFVETFNSDSESEYCWRIVNGNNDDFTFGMAITQNPYEGNQAAGMFTGTNGANDDWLISPTITVTANQRLRYFYRVNSSNFEEDVEVLLSTNGIGLDQFTTVLYNTDDDPNPLNNVQYLEKVINIPEGITGDINIAWRIPQEEPTPWGYRGQIFIVDNVIVEDIPACPTPVNVSISNITDTTVDVNWEVTGDETEWEIVVQPYGTDAPGVTPNPEYTYLADAYPFTITNLDPASNYQVYVRAICDSGTEWTQPIEVTTLCSFENLCEYTITLSGGPSNGIGGGINVIQNGVVVQTLDFPTGAWNEVMEPLDFIVYLCTGVEFSLFWDSIGTAPGQYPGATVTVTNTDGVVVSTTDLGLLPAPRSTFFTGIATCGVITCPQPIDLSVNEMGELLWTPGASETSWEVAIQPYGNATLPQSGVVVMSPSYTPQASDLNGGNINTYEYFVRAICGDGDESYWSGPYAFVVNDDSDNAIVLSVSDTDECATTYTSTFINSSASSNAMSCEGSNNGDIWYEFVATSTTHMIILNEFSGNYDYSSGDESHAPITLVLYSYANGNLEEQVCSRNNAIATLYSNELTIGETYKIRVVLNSDLPSTYAFNVCVRTITDPCAFEGINGSFEDPIVGPNFNFLNQNVTYGWRNQNIYGYWSVGVSMYIGSINTIGVQAQDGSQFMQMLASETGVVVDLNNIDGLYQDFDSSEVTIFDYSFLHATRGGNVNVQLYAGAPEGPFELIYDSSVSTLSWQLREGSYIVPEGQSVTRFVFRPETESIGNLLDGIKIIANNEILTIDQTLDCDISNVTVEANGFGTWVADENNPAVTTIADMTSRNTTISGFTVSGDYTYYWRTRYCENSVTFTYQAFTEVPTVTSPVEYCLNQTAQPLTATSTHSLLWFTDEVGGTGNTTAPTPVTTSEGSTTYYVANVNAAGCEGPRVPIEVIVNPLVIPVVEFTYANTEFCINDTSIISVIPSEGFTTGGVYQSTPSGLNINSSTGEITIATSQAGVYEVTYTYTANGCIDGGSHSETITINSANAPVMAFSYDAVEYCMSGSNPILSTDTGFDTNGTFTVAPQGLTIDAATGAIDLSTSQTGTYQITYAVDADNTTCTTDASHSFTITIIEDAEIQIVEECDGSMLLLQVVSEASFEGYIWTNENGNTIGANSATFNVTEYLQNQSGAMLPLTFYVEAMTSSGCASLGQITINEIPCMKVPRGISPNGDAQNDTFDLRGMRVNNLIIFNRHGVEVYKFSGNYTNQWEGQTNKGDQLPDGTYFYSIETQDGNAFTGWVYINR